jgi:hypothetical protein
MVLYCSIFEVAKMEDLCIVSMSEVTESTS